MHLQGRVGLRLREAVLRGRRLCLSPMTKWVVIPEARVWQPASCPAPFSSALEPLVPQPYPHPHPPSAHPPRSSIPASHKSDWKNKKSPRQSIPYLLETAGAGDFISTSAFGACHGWNTQSAKRARTGFGLRGSRRVRGGFLRAAAGRAHCGGGSSFLGHGKQKDGVDSCIKARIQGALS